MYYLFFDTCVWIDLCKKHIKVGQKIANLVELEKVRLVISQIVIDEWYENKEDKIIKPKEKSIRGKVKNARDIFDFFAINESESWTKTITDLQNENGKLRKILTQDIEIVEGLFDHPSTVKLDVSEKSKLQAVDFALAKKAPFQNKNSMADALILFDFVNYVAEQGLTNSIFVSSNTTDFCEPTNKNAIHPDLEDVFKELEIRFFSNFGLAINEIENGLINDEEVRKVEAYYVLDTAWRKITEPASIAFATSGINAMEAFAEEIQSALGATLAAPPGLTVQEALAQQYQSMNDAIKGMLDGAYDLNALSGVVANPDIINALTAFNQNIDITNSFRHATIHDALRDEEE